MASVDGERLLFLDNNRLVSRGNLWAVRLLAALMMLAGSASVVKQLQAGGVARGAGAFLGATFALAVVYWAALRYTSTTKADDPNN